jgi:hypothetical protein
VHLFIVGSVIVFPAEIAIWLVAGWWSSVALLQT